MKMQKASFIINTSFIKLFKKKKKTIIFLFRNTPSPYGLSYSTNYVNDLPITE